MEEPTLNALRALVEGGTPLDELPASGGPLVARLSPDEWKWLRWYWRWRGQTWLHRLMLAASGVPESGTEVAHPDAAAEFAAELLSSVEPRARDAGTLLLEDVIPASRFGEREMGLLEHVWRLYGPGGRGQQVAEKKGLMAELWRRVGVEGWSVEDVHGLFEGGGNGDISLLVGDTWGSSGWTVILFSGQEWEALFRGVFDCPYKGVGPPGETYEEARERHRRDFLAAMPEYPMLARIHDLYEDAAWAADEVPALRAECERAEVLAREAGLPLAGRGLRKLRYGCAVAARAGKGLRLLSD